MSSARRLVAVMVSVVVAFLAATAVSQCNERRIASRVVGISDDTTPGVQLMIVAASNVRAMQRDVDLLEAEPPRVDELRAQLASERHELDATLASYLALPMFPGEDELIAAVHTALGGFDSLLDASPGVPGRSELRELHRQLAIADGALDRIVTSNALQGRQLGLEIERIRSRSGLLVWLLDGLSVLLAVAAMVLALGQLRRTMRNLEAAREIVEKRVSELSTQVDELGNFAGRVAHDVMSPLTNVMFSLELVKDACAHDEMARRAIERGFSSVLRVRALVDGLFAFARAGGKPEKGVTTAVEPVVTGVIDALASEAALNRIELTVAAVPDVRVSCSTGVLTSLVSNLVHNAIRHMGDAAERRIEVRVIDLGKDCRVEVEDTGPGIPAGQEDRIFDPYVQLGQRNRGLGLGLATVDRLVRAHGGAVGVVPAPGHGARFWFELPVSAASASASPGCASSSREQAA